MKHTSIRKPLSVLLSILMVLSVFGGMTFSASAAAVTPKYKIVITSPSGKTATLVASTALPYERTLDSFLTFVGAKKGKAYTSVYSVKHKSGSKITTLSTSKIVVNTYGEETINIILNAVGGGRSQAAYKFTVTALTKCVATATGYTGTYDGEAHTIAGVTPTSPESGATVKYGTASGTYNLTAPPSFTDVGTHTVYYQVSAPGWATKTGSVNVNIQGDVYYVKQNPDGTWPADASAAEHDIRLGDGTTFNLSKAYAHYSVCGWSTEYTANEAERVVAHQNETVTVGGNVSALYVYYAVDTYDLTFYADREGETVLSTRKVGYGMPLSGFAPTVDDNGTWSGENQLSNRNNELFTFGGWATEAGKTVWTVNGTDPLAEAFDFSGTMPAENVNVYPVWVANYIHVILDAGAWDQYNTYTQSKYDPATPVAMDQSQGRSFWKSTNITAASTDYDKYVNMDKMNAATREGYTLDGWYTGSGMKWEPTYLIARKYGDKDASGNLKLTYDAPYRNYTYVLTLTAKWKLNDAKVVYDVGEGTGEITDDAVYAIGSEIAVASAQPTPPANTAQGRYEFKGWQDKNGNLHQPGETFAYADDALLTVFDETNEIGLTAVYQFVPEGSLTFDSQGGSLIAAIEQDVGSEVALETINAKQPTRTGYTFGGWYEDSDCVSKVESAVTITAEATTVYAKWTPNQYTLTFDSKGGTAVESITQDYDTAVTAPADPPRTGYTFTGWDKPVPAAMPAGDMTFNAMWQVNTYSVTFDANGGSDVAAESRNYGEFVVEPAAPVWEGHTFIRWEYEAGGDGDVRFPFTMPAGDVTLKAVWKENQTAPAAPAAEAAATTVTVTAPEANTEYVLVPTGRALTEADWANAKKAADGAEIVFEGLAPNTAYALYARKCETENKMSSPASAVTQIATKKAEQAAPAAPAAAKAMLTSVVVDPALDGAQYLLVPHGQAIPENAVWTAPGEDGTVVFTDCDPNTTYDVYARMKETDRQNASAPSAAVTVKGLAEEMQSTAENDLTYTGEPQELVSAPIETPEGYTVQYSIDGGETWAADLPTGTEMGDYTVKVKYVGDGDLMDFFGDDIAVSIGEQTEVEAPEASVDEEENDGSCPICGKTHNGGIFDKLVGFIHSLIAIFRSMFSFASKFC